MGKLGAARPVLPRTKWKNDNEARYSGEVHYLARDQSTAGPYVKDKNGELLNPKLIKPVPWYSANDVKLSMVIKESNRAKKDEKRKGIYEWAKRMHRDIIDNYAGNVSMNSNPFARAYKDSAVFFQAMKDAGIIGATAPKTTKNFRPTAVMALFPRYFRYTKNRRILAIGVMPKVFVPSDEDDGDAEQGDLDA